MTEERTPPEKRTIKDVKPGSAGLDLCEVCGRTEVKPLRGGVFAFLPHPPQAVPTQVSPGSSYISGFRKRKPSLDPPRFGEGRAVYGAAFKGASEGWAAERAAIQIPPFKNKAWRRVSLYAMLFVCDTAEYRTTTVGIPDLRLPTPSPLSCFPTRTGKTSFQLLLEAVEYPRDVIRLLRELGERYAVPFAADAFLGLHRDDA